MTTCQRAIALLIKSTVTGEAYALPTGFSIDSVLQTVEAHQIATLVYDGALRCGVSPELPAMEALFTQYCQNLIISEQQLTQFTALSDAFEKSGIDHLPLKGCVLKELYPRPELRIMTDADILIRESQYETIRPVMRSLGFEEQSETEHELRWMRNGHLVELRKCLIPPYNKDYYAYYGDGWAFAQPTAQKHRYALRREDLFIFLIVHFAKHYRDCGIGCRHMTDLWICRRAWNDLDEDYIYGELKKLRLDLFCRNVLRTLEVWFGSGTDDEVTDLITDTVFQSGSYGARELRLVALGVRESRHSRLIGIRVLHWLNAVFCPKSIMEMRYPVLKRVPALLPVFWAVRIVQTVLFHRERIGNVSRDAQKLTDRDVAAYTDALNRVGLDFHFN